MTARSGRGLNPPDGQSPIAQLVERSTVTHGEYEYEGAWISLKHPSRGPGIETLSERFFFIALFLLKYVSNVRLFLHIFSTTESIGFTAECFIIWLNCPNCFPSTFTKQKYELIL